MKTRIIVICTFIILLVCILLLCITGNPVVQINKVFLTKEIESISSDVPIETQTDTPSDTPSDTNVSEIVVNKPIDVKDADDFSTDKEKSIDEANNSILKGEAPPESERIDISNMNKPANEEPLYIAAEGEILGVVETVPEDNVIAIPPSPILYPSEEQESRNIGRVWIGLGYKLTLNGKVGAADTYTLLDGVNTILVLWDSNHKDSIANIQTVFDFIAKNSDAKVIFIHADSDTATDLDGFKSSTNFDFLYYVDAGQNLFYRTGGESSTGITVLFVNTDSYIREAQKSITENSIQTGWDALVADKLGAE